MEEWGSFAAGEEIEDPNKYVIKEGWTTVYNVDYEYTKNGDSLAKFTCTRTETAVLDPDSPTISLEIVKDCPVVPLYQGDTASFSKTWEVVFDRVTGDVLSDSCEDCYNFSDSISGGGESRTYAGVTVNAYKHERDHVEEPNPVDRESTDGWGSTHGFWQWHYHSVDWYDIDTGMWLELERSGTRLFTGTVDGYQQTDRDWGHRMTRNDYLVSTTLQLGPDADEAE